ncbi:MAG: DUF4294 domain-containing protein [Flavipsychrobacter sp.]
MSYRSTYLLILSFTLSLLGSKAVGQSGMNDTLLLGGIVIGQDTFGMVYMNDVIIKDKLPKRFARQRRRYNKLRYNVYKVYPYAVIAAEILKDVDSVLLAIGDDKKKRKAYLKTIEKELNNQFKGELSDMTISQGHVLVKLIDRETGKSCYNIVKELKGGFSAVVVQSVARIFSHNLKKEYDAENDDRDIEQIIRELEANQYYRSQFIKRKPTFESKKNKKRRGK